MSKLRPVKRSYTPNYPRRLSEDELRRFLNPAVRHRFSGEVMLLSTVLVGCTLSSCARNIPSEETAGGTPEVKVAAPGPPEGRKLLPGMGKSTRTDPELKRKVDQLVSEVLPEQRSGSWYESSTISYERLIAVNPVSKVPSVRISFGNSINGIFDVEAAARATSALFEAYGISLEPEVRLAGDGYDFVADGYNEELGLGFEIRGDNDVPTWFWSSEEAEKSAGHVFLSDKELPSLEKDVKSGQRDMFVSDPYTIYDGGHVMAMSYYLASVIDYLNWIHGDREIDYSDVLGDKRKAAERYNYRFTEQAIYWQAEGGTFSEGWTIDRGEIAAREAGVASRIILSLEPGGEAKFSIPAQTSASDSPRIYSIIRWSVSSLTPADVPIDFDFQINGISESRTRITRMPGEGNDIELRGFNYPDGATMQFNQITVTNVNGFKVELEVSKISGLR